MEEKNTREVFRDYVAGDFLNEPDEKKTPGYEDKYSHSLFVMDSALNVDAIFTKYNPNYKNLLVIESLFHDIGRFEQMKVTGTFADSEISKFYPRMEDHGDLGARVMKDEGLLNRLIPETRLYDEEVQRVIRDHSKVTTARLNKDMLNYLKVFARYDLEELFLSPKAEKEVEALSTINTSIVQDVDRLDIFRKIVKGIWVPMTSAESIDPEIWKLFKEGRIPSINEIKAKGKWNVNVGHLVRMSFINQMNLVPVLLKIREEGLIDQIYETTGENGPHVKEAYEFAKEQLNIKINSSEDGILISK